MQAMKPRDDGNIVSVLAPGGYGKTTLAIQYARWFGRPTVWVSLGRHDNDVVSLIEKFATAIEQANGHVESLRRALRSPGVSMWARCLPRLRVALSTLPNALVILDDIQEIEPGDASDAISELLLNRPRSTQFVVAGRSSAAVPVSRLLLEHRVVQIGPADLAFTDDEAHALLSAHGLAVSDEAAAELNDRCEGWPAFLTWATLSDGVEPGSVGPMAAISGREQSLVDYIRTELLSTMPRSHASFLLHTSVLDRLSGDLCDYVLQRNGSGSVLRELERSNAFVMALDPEGVTYRTHDLVRDALVAELRRVDSGAPEQLRARAAAWYEGQGLPIEAIHYAMEAGDDLATARTMATHAQAIYGAGRADAMVEWLEWADERRLLHVEPALAFAGAIVLAIAGDADRAMRCCRALEAVEDTGSVLDGSPSVDAWKAVVRSYFCEHGVDQSLADARSAYDDIPRSSRFRRVACVSLGMAWMMVGDQTEAARALTEVSDGPDERVAPTAQAVALGMRARMALQDGDVAAAREMTDLAEGIRRDNHLGEHGTQALQDALAARLALARGETDVARKRLTHAQGLRSLLTWAAPFVAVITRLELAHVHLAMADAPGARTIMFEIQDVLHRRPHLGTALDEAAELQHRLEAMRGGVLGASSLTEAELRLVPLLATHLSFADIASRLHVSRNTVKTQATSLYRKLDATSRREAVEHAAQVGLLDPAAVTAALFAPDDS